MKLIVTEDEDNAPKEEFTDLKSAFARARQIYKEKTNRVYIYYPNHDYAWLIDMDGNMEYLPFG